MIIQRKNRRVPRILAGLLMTAAMLVSFFAVPVYAAEEQLPSGIAVSKLQEEIDSRLSGEEYASWSASVFRADRVLYSGSSGYADKENNIEADQDTVYEWGSISKTMVWVSAMQLYEQGRLDLEKDIRSYLPQGFLKKLRYDDPITMLDLMNHQGGWQPTLYVIQTVNESEIMSLGDALQYSEPVQVFRPGEVSAYSNWGAALAGYVVECISGMSYGEYVHEHILKPLGMEHTSVMPDHRDTPWVREQRDKLKSYCLADTPEGTTLENLGVNMTFINLYPAGSLTGTLEDITLYGQALLKGSLFEKSTTTDLLFRGTDFYDNGKTTAMCHGFFYRQHQVPTVGHSGGTDACTANFEMDLASGTGMAVLTNQSMDSTICSSFTEIVFGEVTPEKGGEITKKEDITGHYLGSSSYFAGPMKFINAFSPIIAEKGEQSEFVINGVKTNQIGDQLFRLEEEGYYQVIGYKTLSDGRKILHIGGMDYVGTDSDGIQLVMIDAYALLMIVSIGLLMIRLFLTLLGKQKPYAGSKMMILSHFARILSVGAIFLMFTLLEEKMALTQVEGIALCSVQILCLLLFAVSLVMLVISMITAKEENRGNIIYYIGGILANGYDIAFILLFDLCCFWL